MITDRALEANRRVGWARYYSTKERLAQERLRSVELAMWLEEAGVPAGDGPLRQLIDATVADVDPHLVHGIRRYVRHNLGDVVEPLRR